MFGNKVVEGNEELRRETSDILLGFTRKSMIENLSLDGITFSTLDEASRLDLEGSFSEEKIMEALRTCKTLGPSGFNMGFL